MPVHICLTIFHRSKLTLFGSFSAYTTLPPPLLKNFVPEIISLKPHIDATCTTEYET